MGVTPTPFHRALCRWYAKNGRKTLPWRTTRDPYAIYVSEVMLQQTQVKTVLERYYFPFLKRFPTLDALAAAPQKDVLHAWQGLGYYNRALNLHKAAKQLVSERGRDSGVRIQEGKRSASLNPESRILIPKDIPSLMSLPGIGRNTAHAIATFAHRQAVPVMEANVKRVLSRIFALERPTEESLWEKARSLLDRKNPFDYNQAIMDIGALLCKKRAPLCAECPASSICQGKASAESYPAAKAKKAVPVRKKHIAVLHSGGKYFAAPRKTKFLQGLYHFVETNAPSPLEGEGRGGGRTEVAPPPAPSLKGRGEKLGSIRQQYSHFTLEADVSLVDTNRRHERGWYSLPALKKLPMSMAEKKILALLENV